MLAVGNCAAPILHRMRFQLSESNVDSAALDEECALWDWVRTAGISAAELREWLVATASSQSSMRKSAAQGNADSKRLLEAKRR